MSNTDWLDELLEDVFLAGLGIAGAEDIPPEDHDRAILNTQKHYTTKAKNAILDHIHNTIGMDESAIDIWDVKSKPTAAMLVADIRNQLRAELRKKLGIKESE